MKFFILISLLSFNLNVLGVSLFDLDSETRDLLNSRIDSVYELRKDEALHQGKAHCLIDVEARRINPNSDDCRYCYHSEQLKRFQFTKRYPDQPTAHCFGTSLFLIQYLLAHPQSMTHSCKEILSEVQNDSKFEEIVHSFSMNQHPYYTFQGELDPIELNPEWMKEYFLALIDTKPSAYYVVPLSEEDAPFDEAAIYTALKNLPNQLIIIGYAKKSGFNHCIVVSTQAEKIFVFDPNLGIYQFPDLETLSWSSARVLKDCRFRWLAAFPSESPL